MRWPTWLIASGSRVISAAMNGRASPTTTAWLIKGCARRRSSSGAGATFLPAAVTMSSFLRPVIRRKPSSSSSPTSPVRNHPSSSNVSAVAASLRQYPWNTCGPLARISPSSAMRIDVAASGRADRAGLPGVGTVDGEGRARLGQAVALEDLDPDAVEEVREPLAEGAAAADGEAHAPAEHGLQLAVHQAARARRARGW